MDSTAPLALGQLLHAPNADLREAAWDELIARHTRLILAAARSLGGGHDGTMERYAYVLEKLRENDFHRLRVFRVDGRARFSTWLTIAARRLCLDHHRCRYGRSRATNSSDDTTALRVMRRLLADSIGVDLDTDHLPDQNAASPESETIRSQRDRGLEAVVSRLPAKDRLLLVLRFEEDLPASRIAALLEFPTPFHVYRRLNQILAQLCAGLRGRGIDGADG